MKKIPSIFDTNAQQNNVSAKIVVGLERISETFRTLLWEHSKTTGLSPIQIQILIFIQYHDEELCGVSYLAKEFNMAKPTISDAVKSLEKKGLIIKEVDSKDSRVQIIKLTPNGIDKANIVNNFALPIVDKVEKLNEIEQLQLLDSISKIIYKLNQAGIITVQRTCYGCKHYRKTADGHHCDLMNKLIVTSEIRVDCPEYLPESA